MVRSQCREEEGLKKGPWTPEEDQKLLAYIEKQGHGSWRALPAKAGLQRCGKSCRLRWTNYLRPDIKRGKFSLQEEQTIIQLHALLGNRWSAIATHLPKRTDNEIKNYWNTHLKKRLDKMGIDPVTHKRKANTIGSCTAHSKDAANLSHMAQWETARLDAEARLVRESKLLVSNPPQNQLGAASAPPAQLTTGTAASPPRPQCLDVLKAWQGVVFSMFSAAAAADSLESPTSISNFKKNALHIIPAVGSVHCHEINSTGTLDRFATNNNNNNNVKRIGEVLGNDCECFEELSQMPQVLQERLDCTSSSMAALIHEIGANSNNNDNAWFGESFRAANNDQNAGIWNMSMEGLSDILGCNFDEQNASLHVAENNNNNNNNNNNISGPGTGTCGGNLEENRNYWDSLLNLLDV